MSFANELQKLKNLRDSGGITREEYEASRNRLLEECVRRIESVHDRPAKPSVLVSQPPNAMNASVPASSQPSESEPRVKFPQVDRAAVAKRSSTYSEELDYSLVKPPARRGQAAGDSSATAYALAKTGVDSVPSAPNREERAGSPEPGVPRVKFSSPPPFEEPDRSHQPAQPVEQNESPAAAAPPAPSVRVAYETVKINPAAPRMDARQNSVNVDASEDLGRSSLTPSTPSVQAFQVDNKPAQAPLKTAPRAPNLDLYAEVHGLPVSSPLRNAQLNYRSLKPPADVAVRPVESIPSTPRSEPDADVGPLEAASLAPAEDVSDPLMEELLPRFAACYDSKPAERNRWGLPRFKLVTGVVQDVRPSLCNNSEAYAASVDLDGQQMEISSSSEIRITAGDRVSLGGYERDGQLLVLGYRNETNGSHSDLNRLRKRYRFLLTIGRLSLLVGLAALAATVMLFLRKPVWASHFAQWGYVPYVASGLVAAAVSYLGLALSFVGKWAKEFHSALEPSSRGSDVIARNPPSALPATY